MVHLHYSQINSFRTLRYGAQTPLALQLTVDGQFTKLPQFAGLLQVQETAAMALRGATREAITGKATIDAKPIVFRTCRRDRP